MGMRIRTAAHASGPSAPWPTAAVRPYPGIPTQDRGLPGAPL